MGKTLMEYATWLDERKLLWPAPPKLAPVNATPSCKPLPGIKAVLWSIYGTLLRITDGELLQKHPLAMRMEIALDKTIHEFNMWNSMSRKPGAPWEYMQTIYLRVYDELRMRSSVKLGETPEVSSSQIWRSVISRLDQKDYQVDESLYGDRDELAEKIAYFFHSSLQGTDLMPYAGEALQAVRSNGRHQGIFADGQSFSLLQLIRALRKNNTPIAPQSVLNDTILIWSYALGVRKPSSSLYDKCVERLGQIGLSPAETLIVGTNMADDLAIAKKHGFRTALVAIDKLGLKATSEDLNNKETRPDRLLTDLRQIEEVVS